MRLKYFILIITILCVSIPAIVILETALGYFPGAPGWKVAEIAAEKHNVLICKRITALPWGIFSMGPSVSDSRFSCIHEYAKLTKDPSACELLMPSSYGWSCLGVAQEPNSRQCWFDFGPSPPHVGSGNNYVTFPECGGKTDEASDRCCAMAKVLYIEKNNSCDQFQDSTILHDQCLDLLANREKDINICSPISNDNVRSGCEVAVRALNKM